MTARGLREEEGREGGIEQKGGLGEREGGGEVCRETGSCFCLRWASRP